MKHPPVRQGFTLVEVLVVIAIIGILSGMAVVGFRTLIAAATVKGQVQTVSAFLDQVSAHARNQVNQTGLSVKASGNLLLAYSDTLCVGTAYDSLTLDGKTKFETTAPSTLPSKFSALSNWADGGCVLFKHTTRIGLNPLASEGYFRIRSVSDDNSEGVVGKIASENFCMTYISKDGGTTWSKK